jgi:hypothetical protein
VSAVLPQAVEAVTNIITAVADALPGLIDAIVAVIP